MLCTRAGKSAVEGKAIHLAGPSVLDQASPTEKRQRAREWGDTQVSGLDYLVPQTFLLSDLYPGIFLDSDAIADIEPYQSDI